MAFYLSPLVDVNEIDLSTTIPAVATSIGVIVLRNTFKGPENKQVLVTDEADLIRAFGEPMDRVAPQASSYEDLMAATGFLKYGNKLYCTRVMPDDARFATNKVDDTGTGAELTTGGNGLSLSYADKIDGIGTIGAETDNLAGLIGTGTYNVTVDGSVAGLGAELEFVVTVAGTIDSITLTNAGSGFAVAENLVVPYTDLQGGVGDTLTSGDVTVPVATVITGAAGVIEAHELQMVSGGIRYEAAQTYDVIGPAGEGAVLTIDTVDVAGTVETYTVTSGGSEYVAGTLELRLQEGQADIASGTLDDFPSGDPDDFGDDFSVASGDLIWTIGMSRGDWGDDIRIAFLDQADQQDLLTGTTDPVAGMPSEVFSGLDNVLGKPNDFLVLVQAIDQRKNTWVTKETWNVSTDPNALDDTGSTRFVEKVVNQFSQYIRQAVSVDMIGDETDGDVIAHLATLSSDTWYDLGDGYDGAGQTDDGNIIAGYRLYENPEEIDINLVIDSGKSDTVKLDIISMCEERYDCMAVLDCPKSDVINNKGNEALALRDWRNSVLPSSSYAAVYGNWIEVYDKFNQKYRWIPASGHVTGVYAKTDDVRDPWWAPAGLNRAILSSVRRLAWNPKLGYRDILYSNGINPIVTFPGEGKVIWGQKTMLSKASAFDRINVRRLFLVLEKAISTAAVYFLFEPNDPATRSLLVNMIQPFLRDVQARRGIYDFKVVCDDTNNTPVRVDRNELWCNIFIKPTRTAEFIVLNFVATATGASFEEAAAAV